MMRVYMMLIPPAPSTTAPVLPAEGSTGAVVNNSSVTLSNGAADATETKANPSGLDWHHGEHQLMAAQNKVDEVIAGFDEMTKGEQEDGNKRISIDIQQGEELLHRLQLVQQRQEVDKKQEVGQRDDWQFSEQKMQKEISREIQRELVMVNQGKIPGGYSKGEVRQLKETKLLYERQNKGWKPEARIAHPQKQPFFKLRPALALQPEVEKDIREAKEREEELRRQRCTLYGENRQNIQEEDEKQSAQSHVPDVRHQSRGKLECVWPPPAKKDQKKSDQKRSQKFTEQEVRSLLCGNVGSLA
ncbi:hypothetical protein INR49_021805 [Caranx melampygus]|nr:hypothetical protein INR49_021805 [Caranx melampygus]